LVLSVVLVVVWLVVFGYGSSSAWADGCANAALRAENNSGALPDCRAYEMVSPPYKEGFTVAQKSFSDDGAVDFISTAVINGGGIGTVSNQYVATRSVSGWTTVGPAPPTGLYFTVGNFGADAMSADLHQALWKSQRFVAPVDDVQYLYRVGLDGSLTRVGPAPSSYGGVGPVVVGASADLGHIVFTDDPGGTPLRELVGTGNTAPGRVVSVDNDGECVATQEVGMSVDGRVIVFNSGCHGVSGLWARVAGSATVAVSGSECTRMAGDRGGVCNGVSPVSYVGSAADGSRVFFTTDQQLVDTDTDTTGDLYACDIPGGVPAPVGVANPCSALRRVSGVTGVSARVQSVAAVSEDGSRVYFVANGVLADNVGVNRVRAVDGADNLYVWGIDAAHPDGKLTFIDDLAGGGIANARTTPDGRYLVFGTAAGLVTDGPGADSDGGAVDLYRYDAQAGALVRVSTGLAGSGGNTPGMDASNNEENGTMTADGSTIVFVTGEALSSNDVDGVSDVYAWHDDGRVSLISDGQTGGTRAWVTPSGRDIFFTTAGRLTALDGDANEDIYDARVGGGFDLTRPAPCFADSCQGPSPAPGLPGPSGEPGDRGDEAVVPAFSVGSVSATQRRRLAQTGKLTLVVKTNTPGVVTVSGSVTGLPGAVPTSRKTIGVAATVKVTVGLSKKARGRLAARGRLSVGLVIGHSKVALSRSMTLRLTHTKTKNTKKARAGRSSERTARASAKGSRS
jgi:hypothetical protein